MVNIVLHFSFLIHCCSCPAPHSATRICLFLRRNARTAVRRRCGRGRGLPRASHWHPCPHRRGTHQHLAVPEQSCLWIKVSGDNFSGEYPRSTLSFFSYGGTAYDSLGLGQSSSGYVNNKYGSDNNQGKAGSSASGAGSKYSHSLACRQ